MRKRIIHQGAQGISPADGQDWLDVERLVQVELTSEDAEHPIESALIVNRGAGWRAQQPGEQTIRLIVKCGAAARLTGRRLLSTLAVPVFLRML